MRKAQLRAIRRDQVVNVLEKFMPAVWLLSGAGHQLYAAFTAIIAAYLMAKQMRPAPIKNLAAD